MKSFTEVITSIKEKINKLEDEQIRSQVQAQFDKIPQNVNGWRVRSHFMKFDVPATLSPEEITVEYIKAKAEDRRKYYGENIDIVLLKDGYELRYGENHPQKQFAINQVVDKEKLSKFDVEFDVVYEFVEHIKQEPESDKDDISQELKDLQVAEKSNVYNVAMYETGATFKVQTMKKDTSKVSHYKQKGKKIEHEKSPGVWQTDHVYEYVENTNILESSSNVRVREVNVAYSYDDNLKTRCENNEKQTMLISGEVVDIIQKQTLEIEGEDKQVLKKRIRKMDAQNFEKTITKQQIKETKNIKEVGKICPGEKLTFDLAGEKTKNNGIINL